MNSLEFINIEIAITRTKYKENLKFNHTAFAIKDEKRLQTLQQIKTILEAWEVVKNKIKPCLKLDKEEHQPAYYWWIADEIINLDTLEYQALKKALEVENE